MQDIKDIYYNYAMNYFIALVFRTHKSGIGLKILEEASKYDELLQIKAKLGDIYGSSQESIRLIQ